MEEQDRARKALEDLGPGYELVRELGRGATAVVYLVRDHELDRDLAVKVIRSAFSHDEEAAARLEREARLVAQLQHPNIVRVFSTRRVADGTLALLMEHVPGRNLKEVLRATGPFEPARALGVLEEVASALAYAHRRRIVHRDVKPENIYVDEEVGAARLSDFGIARPWDRDARLTVPGEALGTPAYMSPEQIDGEEVDARTDVYSLGLVGYEMLAGEHPWEGDSLFNIIFKQKNEDLPPLRSLRPELPRALVGLLERALEKDRERRWESAEALLEGLTAVELRDAGRAAGRREPDASLTGAEDPSGGEADAAGAGPEGRPRAPGAAGPPAGGGRAPPGRAGGPEPSTAARSGPDREAAPSGGGRWRKGRLAAAAGVLAVLAVATWSWASRGSGEGWVSLDAPEAGVRPGAGDADEPPGGPVGATDPGAPDPGEGGLQAVDDQTPDGGTVGSSVPLVLRTPAGDSAARVRFRVVDGGGVLDPPTADAGSDGLVRTTLRLPDRAGSTTVGAALEDGSGPELLIDFVATPGPPQRVLAIVGENQVGDPGSPLPQALGVRVVDGMGNAVPGADVRFRVLTGEGTLQPARVTTDSLGRAFARWNLGPAVEGQQAAALVPAAEESSVIFAATARALAVSGPDPAGPGPPAAGDTAEEPSVDPSQAPADTGEAAPATDAAPPRVLPRSLAVGGTHACVIGARGFAECGGVLDPGEDAGAVRVRFVALAAGVGHACGLDATGAAYCWGANERGQLGDGSRDDRGAPTPVETSTTFERLALGLGHSCGLDGAARVHCWGGNASGQLGDGSRNDAATPRATAAPEGASDVVAGWNHTCALAANGRALCWGINSEGQLGDGSRADRTTPTPVAGGATYFGLAAGSAHTCGVEGGVVRCWGADGSGQLGIGGSGGEAEPVRLESLPATVVAVTAGALHTCALLQGGEAWCWGQNLHGQLGDGSTTDRRLPTPVAGGLSFRTLAAGGGSTCGVTADGARYCWGLNQSGQLGDGSRVNRSTPTRVGG